MGDISLIEYINRQIDLTLNWDDIAYFADLWKGPLAIKGIQSPSDAKMAKQAGATAIMISNHGGRQLGCAPAPVDCIAPMRDAVGNDLELICEGGARRGTDVLKALALVANAVATGRPYLFGLAAGGEAGAFHAMDMLRKEVERGMALMGAQRISDITDAFIVHRRR
jgi:L-lactate dehydrogenase (cytochrome)